MNALGGFIVVLFGLSLLAFTVSAIIRPESARRFLLGFASSQRAHFLEQTIRLVVGAGLIIFSPEMRAASFFQVLGWALVVTSMGLMLIPWRWHNRFAQKVVPPIARRIRLYGVCTALLGIAILYAALG